MEVTRADVHWTAGFLDGDGTIGLVGKSPRLGATQADLIPLEKLMMLWGGTISPKKTNIGTKVLHAWALGGHRAIGLLMMAYDLMSIPRQQQIHAVVGQWKNNGAVSGEGYYGAVLNDTQALEVMRAVKDGEPVTRAAQRVGISHATLLGWLQGTRRPSLLAKFTKTTYGRIYNDSPPFAQRHVSQLICDLHYTAGFLEAEGAFSSLATTVRIQGIQIETEPLMKLQSLWGGAIYQRKSVDNRRPVSAWHLNGASAAGLMMTLYPLMSPSRKGQIATALTAWKHRGTRQGEGHASAVATDEEALAAMRHLRDGRSYETVAATTGISRFVLGMWMRGRNRPYLLQRLEAEGKPSAWQYNGGRRKRIVINDENALQAIRRVKAGESINSVARSLDVQHVVVLDWVRGKNRPHLLAQVLQEEQLQKEGT